MAYVLSKCLDNDICDEINKLVVNDKINELEDDNIKLAIKVDDLETKLEDEINDYDTFVSELQQEIYDLREMREVSIPHIITTMNRGHLRQELNRFERYADFYFQEPELNDIAENYDNFEHWYSIALPSHIQYITYAKNYKITLSQIFQVKRYFKENDDDGFELNLDDDFVNEQEIARKVVSQLILMRINEQVSNNAIQIKKKMEDWYNEKIEEEEEEEQNERMKDAEMEENERKKEEAEMNAYEKCMEEMEE